MFCDWFVLNKKGGRPYENGLSGNGHKHGPLLFLKPVAKHLDIRYLLVMYYYNSPIKGTS